MTIWLARLLSCMRYEQNPLGRMMGGELAREHRCFWSPLAAGAVRHFAVAFPSAGQSP